ncbi:Collagen triple helix repeat [Phytophthora cinnamomi]|uniref:Collagen triple helix repeat n=1 Tax=Phytophthora cinnamomi TaxID=4785 RepID=UPI0035599ADC|nr:Collagen triple helix repeat [Phytophthora cinnamomi]
MRAVAAVLLVACTYVVAADGLGRHKRDHSETNGAQRLELVANDDVDPVCYWQMGLSCELGDAANNLKLGAVDQCEVPVPDPLDACESDSQRSIYGGESKSAFIQIMSTKMGSTTTTSTKQVSRLQYFANPALLQSQISFGAPGKYDMEVVGGTAARQITCTGCIAILDSFRPRYGTTGGCPAAVLSPQTLTNATLTAFQGYDNAYKTYTADANVINNPNSGILCATTTDKFSKFKLFNESEKDCTSTCFDSTTLATNVAKLKTTPLIALQSSSAVLETLLNSQCSWCCRKTRTLKEMYTEYACPNDYENDPDPPTPTCKGGSSIPNTCSINLCLQAKGPDIITTSATIKSTIQSASTAVLNALPSKPAGCDATKHVYYTIPCTNFDKTDTNCRYSVQLSQLLDVSTAFTAAFPTPATEATKSKDYVFWRYNLDGKTFVAWNPLSDSAIAFTDASTTVILEAWTACGRAYSTSFTINLFLHSTLTCSKFDAMWQVVEKPGVQGSEGTYCAYGGSDFAILKLSLSVADVLQQVDNTVTGTYTGVQCDIMVKPTGGSDTQVVSLVSDSSSSTINKYYGVELVNNPSTAQKTTGVVHCKFTRTPRTASTTTTINTIDCSHTFTVTDCNKPELTSGGQQDVCANKCAGDAAPGLYESCGGSVVTSTATNTIMKPATVPTCCTKCSQTLTCNAVGSTDVKRCEPPVVPLLLAESTDSLAGTGTLMIWGASVMVVVVASIVVRHREDGAARDQSGYYPLVD